MHHDWIDPAIERLGWTPHFHQQLLALRADEKASPQLLPERIVAEWGSEYGVLGAGGERRCVLSGRLARDLGEDERPCVGDFVLASFEPSSSLGRIEHLFERSGALRRKSAGSSARAQTIAANVDVGFVVSGLAPEGSDDRVVERSLNPRRIERYLRAIRDANARAVVVVTKADLRFNANDDVISLAKELGVAEVVLVSAHTGFGLDNLTRLFAPGITGVLVGSSGVGKSSLVNRLVGGAVQSVESVRDDDGRGRHTTTHRRLFVLPNGGLLIDTPGMRELALFADENTDTNDAGFDEITALAKTCRFRDCQHRNEPGCAVLGAVERGDVSMQRLEHARKLERELQWQKSRHDARSRQSERRQHRALSVAVREILRRKGRDD